MTPFAHLVSGYWVYKIASDAFSVESLLLLSLSMAGALAPDVDGLLGKQMKKRVILPSKTMHKIGSINKVVCPNFVMGTTAGLVKQNNEDSIGCSINKDFIRICIADGHWGNDASRLIVNHWLKNKVMFPNSSIQALRETKIIENKLFNIFGKFRMDPDKDFTPEASFIAIEIIRDKISIVNYGDCRLLIANNGITKFNLEGNSTWLGAFSHLNLRKRLSVNQGTKFLKMKCGKDDFLFLFTDGVDQCVYEKDTISFDYISRLSRNIDLSKIFDVLIGEVFANGAQDNASLGIFRF